MTVPTKDVEVGLPPLVVECLGALLLGLGSGVERPAEDSRAPIDVSGPPTPPPVPRRLRYRPPTSRRRIAVMHAYYLLLVVGPLVASVAWSEAAEDCAAAQSAFWRFWLVGAACTAAGVGLFRRYRVESFAAEAWNVIAIGLAALLLFFGFLLHAFAAEGIAC